MADPAPPPGTNKTNTKKKTKKKTHDARRYNIHNVKMLYISVRF